MPKHYTFQKYFILLELTLKQFGLNLNHQFYSDAHVLTVFQAL